MTPGRIQAKRRRATLARALALAATAGLLLAPGAGAATAPSAATVATLVGQAESPAPQAQDEAAQFGFSVALSADGTTALVGAPTDDGSAGAAWVFVRSGATWAQQGGKLSVAGATDPGEEEQCAKEVSECGFARSVALSADGDTALIGAPSANEAQGAAWVFARSDGTWSQLGGRLVAGERSKNEGSFGRSVALSGDGETALIGAPRADGGRGAAWAFTRSGAGFVPQAGKITGAGESGGGFFARSVALSADGATALIGAPGDSGFRGAVWPYVREGSSWEGQGGKLVAGGEELGEGRFGFSVSLSADGDTGLVGARSDAGGAGAAWALARSGSSWSLPGPKLTAAGELGEGQFGYSTALSADGTAALIGAPHDSSPTGAAFAFARSEGGWSQQEELRAGATEPQRLFFGTGLALSGDAATALVGAPHEGRRLGGVWAFLGTPPEEAPLPPPEEEPAPEGPPPQEPPPPETPPTQKAPSNTTGTNTGTGTGSPNLRSGVLGSKASSLPPPVLGVSGNVTPLAGVVRVKLPGARSFVLLSAARQIPFGSIIDARKGRVSVTTTTPQGGTQTMTFYQGEFKLTQRRDGMVVSTLYGGSFAACRSAPARGLRAAASASHGKHVVRKLWAEGHGKYSTKGSYATGAVLGTRWLTEDLCEGTLIRVLTDRVAVTNLVNGKHATVLAGHSYLAKAPHRRGR